MSEFINIPREPNPSCKLPENLDTPVWRYMDIYKFYSLLEEKALYLCRADLLQDRFEGTYSRHQILEGTNGVKSTMRGQMGSSLLLTQGTNGVKSTIDPW